MSACRTTSAFRAAAEGGLLSSILGAALGIAAVAIHPPVMASDPPRASPPDNATAEVVISAKRAADAALASKVIEVLRNDPYVFTEHVSVSVENGVVTVEGTVPSVQDLRRVLRLARRLAGKGRVINKLELVVEDDEGTG
jgi:hypothetical protein